MPEHETIICYDLDEAIVRFRSEGYRLDMIMPADDPREVWLSRGDKTIRLLSEPPASAGGTLTPTEVSSDRLESSADRSHTRPPAYAGGSDWVAGRAGMMYRDLIPSRLGGKLIASHIRIVDGGDVADSVHYHKIEFQLIYCLKGAIKVVYEDQGDAFWLHPGDCVLQPPEIRHRVLYAEAGSEVIELTSPAKHETWFDHELTLPNPSVHTDRVFGTQRFVRHISDTSSDPSTNQTEITDATGGRFDVYTLQTLSVEEMVNVVEDSTSIQIEILINGRGIRAVLPNTPAN